MIHALNRFPGCDAVAGKALGRADRNMAGGLFARMTAEAVADLRADVVHLFERFPGSCVMAGRAFQFLDVDMRRGAGIEMAFAAFGQACGDSLLVVEVIDLVPGVGGMTG